MDNLLIDYRGEALALVLSFVLFIEIVLAIGYISQDLENAITFTIIAMTPLFFLFMLFHS